MRTARRGLAVLALAGVLVGSVVDISGAGRKDRLRERIGALRRAVAVQRAELADLGERVTELETSAAPTLEERVTELEQTVTEIRWTMNQPIDPRRVQTTVCPHDTNVVWRTKKVQSYPYKTVVFLGCEGLLRPDR